MKQYRAIALLLAAGCSSAPVRPLPAYLSNPGAAEHSLYPRSRYLVAAGSGTSFEDAAIRAKAEIAGQIRAEVASAMESFQSYVAGGAESEHVTVMTRVTASWGHAELIRVVEYQQRSPVHYVFVAMDRAEADVALVRDGEATEESFALMVEAALLARREGRVGDFAIAAREAKAGQLAVETNLVLHRAVLLRPSSRESQYRALRESLEAALAEARARRVVDVLLRTPTSDARLVEYAIKAVHSFGITHVETKGCEARAVRQESLLDAAELLVEPRETCTEMSLGEKCEVEVVFKARGCASGGVGESTLKMKGAHPSDKEKARKAAWSKVTYDVVNAVVRDALRGAVAIGVAE